MPAALDKRIDWPNAYAEWLKFEAKGGTMQEYADSIKRNRDYLYNKFKEYRLSLIKDDMAMIVAKGVNVVKKHLNETECQPEFALKATVAMADRIGLAPQNNAIQVNNNVAIGINLVAKDDADSIKSMLGGGDVSSNADTGREELPDSGTLE
jgi:hypothetical protein